MRCSSTMLPRRSTLPPTASLEAEDSKEKQRLTDLASGRAVDLLVLQLAALPMISNTSTGNSNDASPQSTAPGGSRSGFSRRQLQSSQHRGFLCVIYIGIQQQFCRQC